MSQNLRLLTRKSSRQIRIAGKARILTKEALLVEDVIAVVEHIVLGTHYVVDPNTTPRPTC
jgi:hypothetical protein